MGDRNSDTNETGIVELHYASTASDNRRGYWRVFFVVMVVILALMLVGVISMLTLPDMREGDAIGVPFWVGVCYGWHNRQLLLYCELALMFLAVFGIEKAARRRSGARIVLIAYCLLSVAVSAIDLLSLAYISGTPIVTTVSQHSHSSTIYIFVPANVIEHGVLLLPVVFVLLGMRIQPPVAAEQSGNAMKRAEGDLKEESSSVQH